MQCHGCNRSSEPSRHTHLATSLTCLNTWCPEKGREAPSVGQHSAPRRPVDSCGSGLRPCALRMCNSLPRTVPPLPTSPGSSQFPCHWVSFQAPGGQRRALSSEPQARIHLGKHSLIQFGSDGELEGGGPAGGEGVLVTRRGGRVAGRRGGTHATRAWYVVTLHRHCRRPAGGLRAHAGLTPLFCSLPSSHMGGIRRPLYLVYQKESNF